MLKEVCFLPKAMFFFLLSAFPTLSRQSTLEDVASFMHHAMAAALHVRIHCSGQGTRVCKIAKLCGYIYQSARQHFHRVFSRLECSFWPRTC